MSHLADIPTHFEAAAAANLLAVLQQRFAQHPARHPGITWDEVHARLQAAPHALRTLFALEHTGGEPDLVAFDTPAGQFRFCDCSPESPAGRRSLCYDNAAHAARKANKPAGSALAWAEAAGATLLTEQQYQALQALTPVDTKTSSWLLTPPEVRALGGALFGDRRYNRVFTYHNGAESYYAVRGFRATLLV